MKFSSAALATVLTASTCDAFAVNKQHSTVMKTSFVPQQKWTPTPSRTLAASTLSSTISTTTSSPSTSISSSNINKRRGNNMSMFTSDSDGGFTELKELTENSPKIEQQIRKSPSLLKMAGYATIPASALLGFGLVPSRRLAAHAVGGIITGIAGSIGKSKIDSVAEKAALPAIAQTLIDIGIDNPKETWSSVRGTQEDYGVLDEDFANMCTEVYKTYFLGMVKHNLHAKTGELKELEQLRESLNMDNMAVGEAHANAAAKWYGEVCLFTPVEDLEDPGHIDRIAMDKLLFLTERALRQGGETEEAFLYEFSRVAKCLDLTYYEALDRVASVAEPFYKRALKSTRSKLETGQVSSDMLTRARKTLGISDQTSRDMHIATFNGEVKALLGLPEDDVDAEDGDGASDAVAAADEELDKSKLKFQEGSAERLNQLRDVLELTETDAEYEITLEATPLYQVTALDTIKEVLAGTKSPDEAWTVLSSRREELLLREESSKDLLSSMVMQALGGPLEETNKFAKVGNEAATYDHLLEAMKAKEALLAVLSKSGWNDFERFDDTFCNPNDKYSANGFLSSEERIKMFSIFQSRTARKSEDGKLSEEDYEKVMEIKGLLGITDDQAEREARLSFGPELNKVLETTTTEIMQDYTPELAVNLKKKIDEVMESYKLNKSYLREVGSKLYADAVSEVRERTPGGIPSAEGMEALDALRELFAMETKDTYPAHIGNFGDVYKKSVLEAMGSTGVILPQYRPSLDELRDRLGVPEAETKKLFLQAVEEKMKPKVEWIVSEVERQQLTQQQLSQKRGRDMGEDLFQTGKGADGVLGLGAEVNTMSDIINLVDFYTENDIVEKEEVGTTTVEKKVPAEEDGGEETTVTEEVPVYESTYPVTALGSDCIEQEMAELLYRQFIVGGFTNQGPQAARYEGAKATFGGILGLTSETMEEIGENIGSAVYENFINNAMKTKTSLDSQDMMFLSNIQSKLGLTSEQSQTMLMDAQKKFLSEEVDNIMDDPTPEAVKAFREKCNVMGMELMDDVGISNTRIISMFEVEIIPGLRSGEISVENSDVLQEIQESLGLDPDECEKIFENLIVKMANIEYDHIAGELMRGREENCVEPLKQLVRYAKFAEGDLGLVVPDEATGWKIYNVFDALDFGDEDADEIDNEKKLLKVALGLS